MHPRTRNCHFILNTIFLIVCYLCTIAPAEIGVKSARASKGGTGDYTNGNVPVLTYKYDNQRTGENPYERLLTTANVNTRQFGQLMSYPVDGQVYAQPLYVPGVTVGGHTRNLVIIATEHDTVYAFDADRVGANTAPIWHAHLLGRGDTPVAASIFRPCTNLTPELGITSTPVIDSASGTLFVVSYVNNRGKLVYALHALDITSGRDKSSPARLQMPGNGLKERQRAGLLLANGRVYIAFASFCDQHPFHGIILSYSYDGQRFRLRATYNDTPGGTDGGIWSSGSALAADEDGSIYAMSGNGTFDLNQGGQDAGDSFVRLDKNLRLADYFTPFNQRCLAAKDIDLGSGGPLLVPGNELIGGGKEGRIYVINTRKMGHFRTVANPCAHQQATNLDAVVQELPPHTLKLIFSTPAYWNGPDGQYVFFAGLHDHTKAFRLSHGCLSGPISQTPEIFGYSGGNPVISSNGSAAGTGILWLLVAPGELRAYDAANLSHELYQSKVGLYNKFVNPIVTNGKVFVTTQDVLKIYGLLPTPQPANPVPTPARTPAPIMPTPTVAETPAPVATPVPSPIITGTPAPSATITATLTPVNTPTPTTNAPPVQSPL